MDAQNFDAFVRSLTVGSTRRGALSALLGGLLAAVASWPGDSAAKKKKKKKKKKKGKPGCPAGQECGGACGSCPGTQTCCDGECFETSSDVLHCGDCETVCDAGESCTAGVCLCSGVQCGAAFTCCNEQCINTSSDESNCGGCGDECDPSEICAEGTCRCGVFECSNNETCCDEECVNIQSDTDNCGACGVQCGTDVPCNNGVCLCGSTLCGAGLACCDDECVDPDSDLQNCGACGTRCKLNETCEAGVCTCGQNVCGDGFTCCEDGGCICAVSGGFGDNEFGDPETCDFIAECPSGTTECVVENEPEGSCRTCCPANATCDTSLGVCFPETA